MSVELCGHCLARDLVCLGDCASNTPDQNPWQGANVFERLHRQGRTLREAPASVPECQGGSAGSGLREAPVTVPQCQGGCAGSALRETLVTVPECQGGCAGGTSGQAPEGELVAKWCARREGVKTPT